MPIYGIALAGGSPSSFSQTNNCGTSLAAGANCRVDVVFKPSSTGSKSARLNVTAGAGNTKAVVLTGTGVNASVTYTLSPLSIDFGNQAKGTSSAARVVQVKNNGTSVLAINQHYAWWPEPYAIFANDDLRNVTRRWRFLSGQRVLQAADDGHQECEPDCKRGVIAQHGDTDGSGDHFLTDDSIAIVLPRTQAGDRYVRAQS